MPSGRRSCCRSARPAGCAPRTSAPTPKRRNDFTMETTLIRRLALAAAVIPALTLPALTLSGPATAADPDRARIEAIVREYLISHPEVLVEAMNALQAREEAKAEVQQRQTLTTRKQELLASPDTPVAGNPQGDVSMVEFFDYQCGYCKAAQPDIDRLIKG